MQLIWSEFHEGLGILQPINVAINVIVATKRKRVFQAIHLNSSDQPTVF